ncbi:MAG: hypothetical protein SVY53_03220 [Chloroflexota bacterium]|nr:hypothetical protein [Chloroflexota bacterium]
MATATLSREAILAMSEEELRVAVAEAKWPVVAIRGGWRFHEGGGEWEEREYMCDDQDYLPVSLRINPDLLEKQPCYGLGNYWEIVPQYSTDIAAAWELVEEMHDNGYVVEVTIDNGTGRYCKVWKMDDDGREVVVADIGVFDHTATAPIAICRAYLEWKCT